MRALSVVLIVGACVAVAALAADPPLPHEDEAHLATIKAAKYGDPGAAKAEQTDFVVHAAGVARAPITAASPFVKTAGTKFTVGGAPVVFAGTNAFYLLLDSTSDADVLKFFDTVAAKGATLVRFFAFTNGYGEGSVPMRTPLQPRVGVFDESQWKRMDLILATAAQKGIRLIAPLANFEPELGGIDWYVRQVLGSGAPKEAFYTDAAVKQAYKNYVSAFLNRKNSITGVVYKDDPVLMSVELMNEPHTSNRYEQNAGKPPGKIVKDWVWEMAAYVKSVDAKHLVSTGEEGYRSDGETPPPHLNWINGGWKGVDFVGNIACPNIDFATVHIYPDNWKVEAWEESGGKTWIEDTIMADRARIAFAQNKPIIMEEYGMWQGYGPSRGQILDQLQNAANRLGYGAALVWAVYAWPVGGGTKEYNFAFDQDGGAAVEKQWAAAASGAISGGGVAPAAATTTTTTTTTAAPASSSNKCGDAVPPGGYTCQQQKDWGKCAESWLTSGGFCARTCGRCTPARRADGSEIVEETNDGGSVSVQSAVDATTG